MKLKRLSILGFKSFARIDNITFSDGFNCIVGSNGCGKSNLIDAIRWVCGETRPSTLRIRDSRELLFQGSKSQKPMGMAQVSCVVSFKNSFRDWIYNSRSNDQENLAQKFTGLLDCSEIEISRRLFSDGEQEYLINGIPARLKDIKDLIRALGLTFRSCSTIGQGEIDKIVELKPAELRGYLEDSCGLSELVEKLKDAKSRISQVESDLQKLTEERESLQVKYNNLKRTISRYERALKAREELKTLIKVKKMILETQKLTRVRELDNKISDLETRRQCIRAEIEQLESTVKSLQQKLHDISNENGDHTTREREKRNQQVFDELRDLRRIQEKLFRDRESALIDIQRLRQEVEFENEKLMQHEEQLASIRSRILESEKSLSFIEEEANYLSRVINFHDNLLNRVMNEISIAQTQKESLVRQLSEVQGVLRRLSESIGECINLDKVKDFENLFSLIFPGFKGVDYISAEALKPGIVYVRDSAITIESAVENLMEISGNKSNEITFCIDEGWVKWRDFIYKVDLNSSNPLKTYKEIERLQKMCECVKNEIEVLSNILAKLDAARQKITTLKQKTQLHLELKLREIRQIKSSLNQANIESLQSEIQRRKALISRLHSQIANRSSELQSFEAEIDEIKARFEQLSDMAERLKNEATGEIEKIKEEINALIHEKLSQIIQARQSEQQIFEEIQVLSTCKMQAEFETRSQIEALLSRYNITEAELTDVKIGTPSESTYVSEIISLYDLCKNDQNIIEARRLTDIDTLDVESHLNKLHHDIERLGKQSMAIFGFDESLLLEFEDADIKLKQMSEVILDSELSLKELNSRIREYENEYNAIFHDFFARVSRRFNETVGRLFPGARGKLESDESGVQVNIQFQNKKMVGLNQLSGGEKTLVSLSLLCALAFESGSPALLLDEVDAPLDDFNTARFLELVKELKKECQIICVTHNKLTMLSADQLLGVTLNQDASTDVIALSVADLPVDIAAA